jgi:hypothetical protein
VVLSVKDAQGKEPDYKFRTTCEDAVYIIRRRTWKQSREAREFLSLSAEKQAEAVEKCYPSKQCTEEEDGITWEEVINKVGGLEEFEHRLTRGCKFMGVEPLNIRLSPENSGF